MSATDRPAAGRVTVMVIDDSAAIRAFLAEILHEAGYLVIAAPDGRTGLALFPHHRPAVVITDLFMPSVDGLEVIRALRAGGAPPPGIVAISGGTAAGPFDLLTAAHALGADRVFRKPFEPARLLAAVAALLRGRADDSAGTGEPAE